MMFRSNCTAIPLFFGKVPSTAHAFSTMWVEFQYFRLINLVSSVIGHRVPNDFYLATIFKYVIAKNLL